MQKMIKLLDINGWAPLHKAVLSENTGIIECLLSFGAGVNVQDNYGNTALHIAIEEGNISKYEPGKLAFNDEVRCR